MFDNVIDNEVLAHICSLGCVALLAVLTYLVLRQLVVRIVTALASRTRTTWDKAFIGRGTLNRLAALAPGAVVYASAGLWFPVESPLTSVLHVGSTLWILLFGLLTVYAILDSLSDIYARMPFSKQLPIRSFVQVAKLVGFLLLSVVAVATVLGESPAIVLTGFGTMTAVLMLVFKDPILGFVAGIQLSANRMLAVGDWMEMPKYNADGDVVDVTLTTVKVRNWDQTITTIPTYALISDSFKNWRGMQEAGGRRICRNVLVDVNSVRFLTEGDIERLGRARLLSKYIREKVESIGEYNRAAGVDPNSPLCARRLTNVGTFRAYLVAYIKSHPEIHQDMISMVRQLQPTQHGLPIQIYAFTKDTSWVAYESVQADIFDHILAVVGEFGLRVHQAPTSTDVSGLTERLSGS